MTNQNILPISRDFEMLLRYVAKNKIVLTPKLNWVPLRHIKTLMELFQVKEVHEHHFGDKIFKKRDETEYERFYFLDLLAISGHFLKISRKNILTKGPGWKMFFAAKPEERGFIVFYAFRYYFAFDNWLHRGVDFGEQMDEKAEMIWDRTLQWQGGVTFDWKAWAEETLRSCGIHWNSPNQTFADDLAIWGLEQCLIKPLEYFGLVDTIRSEGKFATLKSLRLNSAGSDYFKRIMRKSGHFVVAPAPFSLN